MAIKIFALLFVLMMNNVHGGVLSRDGYKCKITSFERELFDKSFVLDNRLMCQGDEDDKLKIDGYCIHTYKCPLDVLNTSRFNTVICLGDGTWDYKYPNCSDMLPVVVSLLEKLGGENSDTESGITKKKLPYPIVKLKSASRLIRPPLPGEKRASPTMPTTTTKPRITTTNKLQAISIALLKQDRDLVNRSCHYTKMCNKISHYPQKCQFAIEQRYPIFVFRLCTLCARYVCDRSIKVNIG